MSPRASLVLASGSPRRRELLARLAVEFEQRACEIDEQPRAGESPEQLVRRLALEKARAAVRAGEIALGADTVVAVDGNLLGKPIDSADARRMLALLSGRSHEVWTGVALVESSAVALPPQVEAVVTRVSFRALGATEIADYVAGEEPLDKAGAYAIQGGACRFVSLVEGELTNVVGLPLERVHAMLSKAGFKPRAPGDSQRALSATTTAAEV